MTIQSESACQVLQSEQPLSYSKTLCALSELSGCLGDSGGPVMLREGDKWLQIGVFNAIVVEGSEHGRACGPNRLMMIRKIPSSWRRILSEFSDQLAQGKQLPRVEFLPRMRPYRHGRG